MKVTLGKMTEFKREVDIVNDSTKVKGNVAVSDGNIMILDNGVGRRRQPDCHVQPVFHGQLERELQHFRLAEDD